MDLRRTLLTTLALCLAALPAAAIGFTDYSGPVRTQFERIRSEQSGDPAGAKLAKQADKAIATLEGDKLETSYAAELSGVSKAAKIAEKSFPDDEPLNSKIDSLLGLYAEDIAAARAAMALDAGSGDETAAKNLPKVDKALAKITPDLLPSKKLSGYSKAAKALGAWLQPGIVSREALFAISSAAVAPEAQSFDFDGDLTLDNALGAVSTYVAGFGVLVNEALLADVLSQPQVHLLAVWDVEDFDEDVETGFGLLNGLDQDGDPLDNYLGFETFLPVQTLDPGDGHPRRRMTAAIESPGAVQGAMEGDVFLFVGFPLNSTTPARLDGTITSEGFSGSLGLPVGVDFLIAWLFQKGLPPEQEANVRALADLDTNSDMVPDSFSCAFAITSVTAEFAIP